MSDVERTKLLLDSWKKSVDVQMHFNDIEIRIRNMAITVVGILVGAGAFGGVAENGVNPYLLGSVSATAWLSFYFMDRLWYHRLLAGAVKQGVRIEKALSESLPEIDLTGAISETSPVKIGKWELHSNQKIDLFYISIACAIVIGTIAVGATANTADTKNCSATTMEAAHPSVEDSLGSPEFGPSEAQDSRESTHVDDSASSIESPDDHANAAEPMTDDEKQETEGGEIE